MMESLASLVASFSYPISELAGQLVYSATVTKFQETRYAALQILGDGDLSLHNTYVLGDEMGSAEKL